MLILCKILPKEVTSGDHQSDNKFSERDMNKCNTSGGNLRYNSWDISLLKMSTCRWYYMKTQGIDKVISIHPVDIQ